MKDFSKFVSAHGFGHTLSPWLIHSKPAGFLGAAMFIDGMGLTGGDVTIGLRFPDWWNVGGESSALCFGGFVHGSAVCVFFLAIGYIYIQLLVNSRLHRP